MSVFFRFYLTFRWLENGLLMTSFVARSHSKVNMRGGRCQKLPKIADVIFGRPPGRRANLGAYKSASSLDTFLTNKAIAIGTLPLLHVGLLDSCQGFMEEIKSDLILPKAVEGLGTTQ